MKTKELRVVCADLLNVLRALSLSATARIDAAEWVEHFERRMKRQKDGGRKIRKL